MSHENTFEALVLRRGNDLLASQGWPESADVEMAGRPGWVNVYARFNGDELAAFLLRLTGSKDVPVLQQHLLNSAALKLHGTDAVMVVYADRDTEPMQPGANTRINFPYAGEWLKDTEISVVLANVTRVVNSVCRQVLGDSRIIRAAITPGQQTRVLTRSTRNFRLVVDECDEENWLGSGEPEDVKRVLDAVLNDSARYCALRVVMIHELTENIVSYCTMHDVLRRPGEPVRRWLQRDLLRDVVRIAREEVLSILNAHRSFDNKR